LIFDLTKVADVNNREEALKKSEEENDNIDDSECEY